MLPDESTTMPASRLRELALEAEGLGFTTAWLPDHVLPPGEFGPTYGGVYEPIASIGYLAGATSTLRFGTSVLIAPLRNPFVLAKQAATLAELSGGRFVLGVGTGWSEPEFAALGVPVRRRGAITDDTLALLRHLFAGGTAPYEGRGFAYEQGEFAPVPTGGVPIMVGGNSDPALRRAARFADVWQGLPSSPEVFAERAAALAELAGGRTVTPALRIGWDVDQPVAAVADEVEAYREAGAQQLAVHLGDHEGAQQRMARLAEAVPH